MEALLKEYMTTVGTKTEARLKELLPEHNGYAEKVVEAMEYSLYAGGKRVRPLLCLAACEAVCGNSEKALDTACALECIHTYSLIHDDLPGMDNDDYRRGKLTNHKVFGEGMAILAGDALLNYAFEILSRPGQEVSADTSLKVVYEIGTASGVFGMIGGQTADILAEHTKPTKELLHYIHTHKTGALIRASARSGAILGGASSKEMEAITTYAEYLGLAFQITDDILDVVGDEAKIGKPVGSDEKNEKATFPSLFGLEESRYMAEDAVNKAVEALEIFEERGVVLKQLAQYLLTRES